MGEGWGQLFNQVLGIALDDFNKENQNRQQQTLTNQQVAAQKDLGRFNQGLAMDTWNKTSSEEEKRKRLENAGLNVGLMYQQGGAHGTTQGGQAGNSVTGGQAPAERHGMGMMMQMAQMQAQIENTKANTELTNAEKEKLQGVDTEKTGVEITSIAQQVKNAEVQNDIMKYEAEIKRVESNIKTETQWDLVEQVRTANDKLLGETKTAEAKGLIDTTTAETIIKQIETNTTEQQLRISAQKAGLIKTSADTEAVRKSITKMANDINMATQNNMREWDKMSQTEREIAIKKIMADNQTIMTEFNTSTPEQIKQWTEIITDILKTGKRK